jgi:hypothetical protein
MLDLSPEKSPASLGTGHVGGNQQRGMGHFGLWPI